MDEKVLMDFPSNSQLKREDKAEKPERRVEKVISGNVVTRKKSFGKKLAETFLGEGATAQTVSQYVIHDVIIPGAKSMICDMVGWGGFAEMLLFGDTKGHRTRRDGGRSYVSYNTISSGNGSSRDRRNENYLLEDDRRPAMSNIARARHDFNDIVLASRGEAEQVLSSLVDLTDDYGQATVADLYDLVGVTGNFTDNKWGWTQLGDAKVLRVRDGYVIDLPRPINVD